MKAKISKRIIISLLLFILLLCIDQMAKVLVINNLYNSSLNLINGFLNITYTENTGGAFGIGSNNTILFILINIVIIGMLVRFLILKNKEMNTITFLSIFFVIAGGIGNLIDRVFRGHVIDYIDINPLFKYPIFNFADICIVIRGYIYYD